MNVPFIDLSRLTREISEDVKADWDECLARCEFVGGPRVTTLERTLERVLGAPHAVTCANGTDAILIALQALGVKQGSKVALPNLTFWATYEAVAQLGAIPVLVDIDPDDLQLSFDEFVKAHDAHRFDAAVLVHLFGWASARLADFRKLCQERGIALLEDGAQSFGVEVNGEPILAKAAVGTLSFYPAKVIGGAMDGGAMTFQSADHEMLVRSLCNHGRSQHYSYAHVGWNSRMGAVQAAFLLRMTAKLPQILESRRGAAKFYRERLSSTAGVKVFGPSAGIKENGYLSVLTSERHDGAFLTDALKKAGIGSARTYPETLDSQPPAKSAIRFGSLAHSKRFCERVVNLPLFYGIRPEECEAAASAFLAAHA
jgi:UDP-2-acetamido-2-deoxy-ribo-hexuluronate aminotransferase